MVVLLFLSKADFSASDA